MEFPISYECFTNMNQELDMSEVVVDMMDRPSLKYICLHLGKKDKARIL
jgi:hypothetical protein